MNLVFLFLAGLLGGAVNTLAGGGSFIVFPALVAMGIPPVIANASNTYAALPGYASGAFGLWKDVLKYRDRLLVYSIVSAVFGYAGAELLLHVSSATFAIAVPWLMLFAVLLFIFGGQITAFVTARAGNGARARTAGTIVLLALLAAVSIYGGFFNAGLGMLLLAFLVLAGIADIHTANGLKLWISCVIALVAVARFALAGSIDWMYGTVALVGVTIGAYLAARLAHHIPTRVIRALVIVYGIGITAYFFWKTYGA